MKEVNYKIQNSIISNEIFCGTITKPNKRGMTMWNTRAIVTKDAIHCVIEHFIQKTEDTIKKKGGKGYAWSFKPNNDYDIELIIKKKEKKNDK